MKLFAPADDSKLSADESTGHWGPLFENSPLGVATTNSTFRYLTANATFLKMLDYSHDELQKLSFLDTCVEEDRDECRDPRRELAQGARLQYEIETRY